MEKEGKCFLKLIDERRALFSRQRSNPLSFIHSVYLLTEVASKMAPHDPCLWYLCHVDLSTAGCLGNDGGWS